MQVFTGSRNLRAFLSAQRTGKRLGFVPTMGALHRGHLSLVKGSIAENDLTVVSIFVNPTQFDNEEDLLKYPVSLQRDLALLEAGGSPVVFVPDVAGIYGEKPVRRIFDFNGLDKTMEGAFRPGHFDGVWTVVRRLFGIIEPDTAYFGEKDFQQLQIIRHMTARESLPVRIAGLPIVREEDGLAMSSRNRRLTPRQRQAAPAIYRALQQVKRMFGTKSVRELPEWFIDEISSYPELKPEYFFIAEESTLQPVESIIPGGKYRAFTAVYAGKIRLIDNIPLYNTQQ